MKSYEFAKVIQSLFDDWRHQKPDHRRLHNDVGMYVRLSMECENYGYEKDGNTRHMDWVRGSVCDLHFVLVKLHSVFLAKTDGRVSLENVPLNAWENTSNHDSCWRTDGIQSPLTSAMFHLWDKSWERVPREHQQVPKDACVDFALQTGCISGNTFGFVRVGRQHQDDGYHWKLTEVGPLMNPKLSWG